MLLSLGIGLSLFITLPLAIRAAIGTLMVICLASISLLTLGTALPLQWAANLLRWLPGRVGLRAAGTGRRFADGLSAARDRKRSLQVLGLSASAWAVSGFAAICNVSAFHFEVPWYAGLCVMLLTNLGGLIPSSPGAIGVYHYLAMMALSLWAVSRDAAFGYALVTHAVSVSLILTLGAWGLARQGFTLRVLR
jgi:uncharacterized membrane protein YbhN (UPF0104 family)